jgi:O-antigen ligase
MTFALFIVYVVLSYIHPGELVPALAPYRVAYWVGMAGLAVSIASLVSKRDARLWNIQLLVLTIFTAVMALSLIVAERWLGAPLFTLQRFGPSLTMFVLALCSVTSPRRMRITAGCVIVLTMALVLQGVAAYHFGYNSRTFLLDPAARGEDAPPAADEDQLDSGVVDQPSEDVNEDEQNDDLPQQPRIRALGMMHDPNDLAMGMIVALGLIGGCWKARPQLRHLVLAAAAGALVYGVYLTRSRGGAVALAVMVWRFASRRIGRVPALVILIVLAAAIFSLGIGGRSLSLPADESASDRLVAWTEGFEMLKAAPILGVGFGQFVEHHTLTAHNSLVLCFAETGLLGCFFWVGLLVVTLFELQRLKNLPADVPFDSMTRQWAEGLQLSLIGFLTAAFFLSRTFVPTLYLVVGLSAALAATARAAHRSIPLPTLHELGAVALACEFAAIGIVYAIVKVHFA